MGSKSKITKKMEINSISILKDNINDRLGFHHVFMSVGVWPMLMALITDEWRNKRAISRDVEDRLYSKAIYIFTKVKESRKKLLEHLS